MQSAACTGKPDCLCVPCMMSDMDVALRDAGLDPAEYRGADSVFAGREPVRTRYAKPGQSTGSGVVRHVSERQVAFIKRLFAERDTSKLVRLPGSEDIEHMSLTGARDLIDRLLGCPRKPGQPSERLATEPMRRFLRVLLAERDTSSPAVTSLLAESTVETVSFADCRLLIEALKVAPRKAPESKPSAPAVEPVTEGMYLVGKVIYKVQRAVHGSGNLYAKVLDEKTGFSYAPGALRNIKAEHRMTLEQAKEFGHLYGMCCVCGATLTDEVSIAAGIGPICARKF
jgi:hypothetical protein